MNRGIPQYSIHYLLKKYAEQAKQKNTNIQTNTISLVNVINDYILPSDIKRSQLYSQLICEAIAHFTIDVWKKNGQKIAGDILYDLSGENERRKLYGTLIQDPRR
jgi:hypothetical protein